MNGLMNMFSWGSGDKPANINNDRNARIENYRAPESRIISEIEPP